MIGSPWVHIFRYIYGPPGPNSSTLLKCMDPLKLVHVSILYWSPWTWQFNPTKLYWPLGVTLQKCTYVPTGEQTRHWSQYFSHNYFRKWPSLAKRPQIRARKKKRRKSDKERYSICIYQELQPNKATLGQVKPSWKAAFSYNHFLACTWPMQQKQWREQAARQIRSSSTIGYTRTETKIRPELNRAALFLQQMYRYVAYPQYISLLRDLTASQYCIILLASSSNLGVLPTIIIIAVLNACFYTMQLDRHRIQLSQWPPCLYNALSVALKSMTEKI